MGSLRLSSRNCRFLRSGSGDISAYIGALRPPYLQSTVMNASLNIHFAHGL